MKALFMAVGPQGTREPWTVALLATRGLLRAAVTNGPSV